MNTRTVADLRKALENVPDSLRVLIPGADHSYYHVYNAGVTDFEMWPDGSFAQWDDEYSGQEAGVKKIQAFVIGEDY